MENNEGTIYHGAWHALRYSDVNGFETTALEDQIFTMTFIVNEYCPGKWEIITISFNTSYSKQVQLEIGKKVEYTWVRENYVIILVLVFLNSDF